MPDDKARPATIIDPASEIVDLSQVRADFSGLRLPHQDVTDALRIYYLSLRSRRTPTLAPEEEK